jgi:hypothetical protein
MRNLYSAVNRRRMGFSNTSGFGTSTGWQGVLGAASLAAEAPPLRPGSLRSPGLRSVTSATFSLGDVIIFGDPVSFILFPPRPTVIYHREGVSSILTQRDRPIWVRLNSEGIVVDYGKNIEPTKTVFANVRCVNADYRVDAKDYEFKHLTQLMQRLVLTRRGRIIAMCGGKVLDVDKEEDLHE